MVHFKTAQMSTRGVQFFRSNVLRPNGDMNYLIIPQADFVLYVREAALNVFVNKADLDQAYGPLK